MLDVVPFDARSLAPATASGCEKLTDSIIYKFIFRRHVQWTDMSEVRHLNVITDWRISISDSQIANTPVAAVFLVCFSGFCWMLLLIAQCWRLFQTADCSGVQTAGGGRWLGVMSWTDGRLRDTLQMSMDRAGSAWPPTAPANNNCQHSIKVCIVM